MQKVAVWPSQGGRNVGRQLSAVELILHSLNTQTQETAGEESGAVQVFAGHCRLDRTGPDAIQRSVTFQFCISIGRWETIIKRFFIFFFWFLIYGHQASHCTKCTPLCVCCSSRHLNRTRSRPMNSKRRPVRFAHCSKRLWPSCKLTVYFPFILLTEFCMYLWLWVSHFNCQDVDRWNAQNRGSRDCSCTS